MNSLPTRLAAALTVPWNAFVAAFIYYTALAAIVLGGASPSQALVGTAYLAPAIAYAVMLLARAAASVAAIRVRPASHLRPQPRA